MQYFNFQRLINRYMCNFQASYETEGYYNDKGDFEAGKVEIVELKGAIINHKESKIYRSEGTLTTNDKRLFMLEPLDSSLIGAKVIYNGNTYRIEDKSENAAYTGVWAYTLKWVSAFDEQPTPKECEHEVLLNELDTMIDESGVLDD